MGAPRVPPPVVHRRAPRRVELLARAAPVGLFGGAWSAAAAAVVAHVAGRPAAVVAGGRSAATVALVAAAAPSPAAATPFHGAAAPAPARHAYRSCLPCPLLGGIQLVTITKQNQY